MESHLEFMVSAVVDLMNVISTDQLVYFEPKYLNQGFNCNVVR